MEIILIILTSTMISAFLFIAYNLGFKRGLENRESNDVVIDDSNKEAVKHIVDWMNFGNDR